METTPLAARKKRIGFLSRKSVGFNNKEPWREQLRKHVINQTEGVVPVASSKKKASNPNWEKKRKKRAGRGTKAKVGCDTRKSQGKSRSANDQPEEKRVKNNEVLTMKRRRKRTDRGGGGGDVVNSGP